MNVQRNTKGFTIIEVVLVLAIAGLIFLMVFIALPALQRSQRDASRKTEVGTVVSAIQGYMSNNRNRIPTAVQVGEYITGSASAKLESGAIISVPTAQTAATLTLSPQLTKGGATGTSGTLVLYQDQIKIYFGYKCSSTASTGLLKGTSKQAAVATVLESGPASGTIYCQSS